MRAASGAATRLRSSTRRSRALRPSRRIGVSSISPQQQYPGEIDVLDGLLRAVGVLEKAVSTIAAIFMFAIMMIVFSDVVMRYAFNRPFSWAYDLISLYLMAGGFFLLLFAGLPCHPPVCVAPPPQKIPP